MVTHLAELRLQIVQALAICLEPVHGIFDLRLLEAASHQRVTNPLTIGRRLRVLSTHKI